MAKKKKSTVHPSVFKIAGVGVLSLVIGVLLYIQISNYLRESDYFEIKVVEKDETLEFIHDQDLRNFIGNNIFSINLKDVQEKLSRKYPQASDLKIIRRYPNRIEVAAKPRIPFAQTSFNSKVLTLDDKGILISTTTDVSDRLPQIEGFTEYSSRLILGLPIREDNVQLALNILKAFRKNTVSSSYGIIKVKVESSSKINFGMSNGLEVIIDNDGLDRKMKILNLILSEGRIDVKEVKYLDLRFKEPIIGKK